MKINQAGLEFINKIHATLEVATDQQRQLITPVLLNECVPEGTKVLSVSFQLEDELENLDTIVVFECDNVTFRSSVGDVEVTCNAPNGKFFTVTDVIKAIEEVELKARNASEWFGGPDVHHVYFEGLEVRNNHCYIYWGS